MDERLFPVEPLTRRERDILACLEKGLTNREIAQALVLSENSVKGYTRQIYSKLGVHGRRAAVQRAYELGLLIKQPKSTSTPDEQPASTQSIQLPTGTALPLGTVTFLFTDIEGSTPLWEREPEKMAEALQIHNAVLRQVVELYDGVVYKIVGDAFQAAFDTALQALKAAIDGQQALQAAPWNELGPLKVRMGLHTGEAELDPGGDEYTVSHTKNRVGRIHAVAFGGQILLSQETADLVVRQLPEGAWLKDLGEQYLKGMALPEHLFQVCVPDLQQDFPPLATTTSRPNNLPLQLTSFIGRGKEIAEIRRLLKEHRLITLTGVGGTGKTRLSLQVADQVLGDYASGVWLVELAVLADPDLVPRTVAFALGVRETSGRPIRELLVNYLRQKNLLLILDNCEHLLEACVSLTSELIHTCPQLTVMASSREILGVEGEIPFRVPPLSHPDAFQKIPLEELSQSEAIRLFVARGQVVAPDFVLSSENAPAVIQLVSRLDGIPLAIELAAARLRMLSVEQIVQRLTDSFRLLTGGSRTVLPRHQTLRASIDWSYNLLSEPERTVLRRLSVFAGSWKLDAAEQICADGFDLKASIDREDIFDRMSELIDKSLVFLLPSKGAETCYAMLETIRQYAHEKLVDAGEAAAARTRHMQYFLQLVEERTPRLRSREQIETLDYLESELGNLRLALEWALQTDIETELSMATELKWLWHIRTHWDEGIQWLERGLEAEQASRRDSQLDPHRAILRANALSVLGFHLFIKGFGSHDNSFNDRSIVCLEESKNLFRTYDGEISSGYAYAVQFSGGKYKSPEQSRIQAEQALQIFRQVNDLHGISEALQGLANNILDPVVRRRYHQEQLEVDKANGDIEGIATAFWNIGDIDYMEADYEQAFQIYETSLAYYRRVQNPDLIGTLLINLGNTALLNGNVGIASRYFDEAMEACSQLGDDYMVPWCWSSKSLLHISQEDYSQAADSIEYAWSIIQKNNSQGAMPWLLSTRARLARLQGKMDQARQFALDGLRISQQLNLPSVAILLELGLQAWMNGDIHGSAQYLREGLQLICQANSFLDWQGYLEAFSVLVARQDKPELAVRLSASRWCRGYYNLLSPSERAVRTSVQAELKSKLGETRYPQLSQEGLALTFMQMLEIVNDLLEINS